ncbi:hypothetical protein ONZ45_g6970 [Pleurotus djamor]|nr:hypothetical protein ONZ45_g6970 [Pleurotus djamor]
MSADSRIPPKVPKCLRRLTAFLPSSQHNHQVPRQSPQYRFSMSVSGIAILGAGIFAKEAHLPALAKLGSTAPQLKAVYSRSKHSAQDVADYAAKTLSLASAPSVYSDDGDNETNLDALLARTDITAVIVVLPITLQPSIILKSLAAGKHVISEKPVAKDVASALSLIQTYETEYKTKSLVWRVAENWEAEPGFRKAGRLIGEGKIGNPCFFNARVTNYIDKSSKWYKTPWRTVPDYQGGFLHTIAALRTLLPIPLTHISSFAALNKSYLPPHDTVHLILKASSQTANAPQAQKDINGSMYLTWANPTKVKSATDEIVVTGEKGWISVAVNWGDGNGPFIRVKSVVAVVKKGGDGDGDAVEEEEEDVEEVEDVPMEGVKCELKAFFDAIAGKGGEGLGEPRNALVDVAVIQAALNSEGSVVDLKELLKTG